VVHETQFGKFQSRERSSMNHVLKEKQT